MFVKAAYGTTSQVDLKFAGTAMVGEGKII